MSRRPGQVVVLAGCLLLMSARAFAAEKQLRGFLGVTFGSSTTLLNLSGAPGTSVTGTTVTYGGSAALLGEVFGVEVDAADVPGFFKPGPSALVLSGRVATVTGNVVVGLPRRWTQYSLRPYLVAGGGLMRVRKDDAQEVFPVSKVAPAIDFGVGAIGFLTNRVGIGWDVRRFQSVGTNTVDIALTSTGDGRWEVSYWRAQMLLAVKVGSVRE